jgi:hypothetical protein
MLLESLKPTDRKNDLGRRLDGYNDHWLTKFIFGTVVVIVCLVLAIIGDNKLDKIVDKQDKVLLAVKEIPLSAEEKLNSEKENAVRLQATQDVANAQTHKKGENAPAFSSSKRAKQEPITPFYQEVKNSSNELNEDEDRFHPSWLSHFREFLNSYYGESPF